MTSRPDVPVAVPLALSSRTRSARKGGGQAAGMPANDSVPARRYLKVSDMVTLADGLAERDRTIVMTVARFGAASGRQLEALFFRSSDLKQGARLARRVLARLTELELLARLERRIGGVRAGSAGHVYRVGNVGRRLVSYWSGQGLRRGRRPHEPGTRFIRHRLAVVDLYVHLVAGDREGRFELLDFEPEPESWRELSTAWGGRTLLKPDAFVRLAAGAYETRGFVEVDLATEGSQALRQQAVSYLDYWHSGEEVAASGVHPRTVWLTTNAERVHVIADVVSSLPPEAWPLFAVGTLEQATDLIAGDLEADGPDAIGGQS